MDSSEQLTSKGCEKLKIRGDVGRWDRSGAIGGIATTKVRHGPVRIADSETLTEEKSVKDPIRHIAQRVQRDEQHKVEKEQTDSESRVNNENDVSI
jgi:hypothetical protein